MRKSFKLVFFLAVLTFAIPAYAEPQIVSGAKNLLNDATTWLLGLIPTAAGLMIGYHALMKQFNDDPTSASIHNKAMKNILVAGAIGVSAVGLVKAFLAYFQ
ncbi:hypothetical protein [Zhaonella formicivorans]|uniref:hypothetical protein n=1 Tax=Zhaonella formicivorans TaxID=2528593 RepID=UPI001D0F7F6F|nr:hypothetical protein [Zhaonella formicivorans]